MLPSDMNLNISLKPWDITTKLSYPMVRLVWGKMRKLKLEKGGDKPKSHKAVVQPIFTHKTSAYEEEKLLWYSYSLEALPYGSCFNDDFQPKDLRHGC